MRIEQSGTIFQHCIPRMKPVATRERACWCGNTELLPFGPDYRECRACGTLVSKIGLSNDELRVNDDEHDFYGKQYWLSHQNQDLGFPDIHSRARSDLTERNLHWLQALLKYRLPPATTLELGCGHGSFVALMRLAGYDAAGVEMSPWVVDFAREVFGVKVRLGPIEFLEPRPRALDVVVLMDVLEHLPDPPATMRYCLEVLKPEGLLLIQTPRFAEGISYEALIESKNPFLSHLKGDEHLYLFSERSVAKLFRELGVQHIGFEPAMFAQYDMFLAVSRGPLHIHTNAEIESALLNNGRRFILALLDLRARELRLARQWEESEADRAGRWEQIQTLTKMLQESEIDRLARGDQIQALTVMIRESEADRVARGEQIQTLTAMVGESEADRLARGEQIQALTAMVRESEADRLARGEQIKALTARVHELQADCLAGKEHIEMLEASRDQHMEDLKILKTNMRTLFSHREFRWLASFAKWAEVKKLVEQLGPGDE